MNIQQAILNYIQLVIEIDAQQLTVQNLTKGVIYSEILNLAQGVSFEMDRINKNPDTWTSRLSNFKILFRALQNFYQIQLKQKLEKDIVDLMKISKEKNKQQTLKFFELMMGVFVRVKNKAFFIERILQLRPQQQSSFASIIKSALKDNNMTQQSQKYQHQYVVNQKQHLLEKMNELEEQNNIIKIENENLKQQNIRIKEQVHELQKQLQYLNEQITQLKSNNFDFKMQAMNARQKQCNNTLVQNLKQKLLSISVQHEKEIIKYQQEIQMMENKIDRVTELEETVQSLQQKIQNLNKKLQSWQRKKKQYEKNMDDKDYNIKKLEIEIKQFKQKISVLELENVSKKMENEKKFTRNQFQNKNKLLGKGDSDAPLGTSRSRLSEICPEVEESNYKNKVEQLQQQIMIQSKRIKQLEKELSRCKIKAQKSEKLEIEKKKLQQILVEFTNSRGQQIQLLTTVLYDLRIKYKQLESSVKSDDFILRHQKVTRSTQNLI